MTIKKIGTLSTTLVPPIAVTCHRCQDEYSVDDALDVKAMKGDQQSEMTQDPPSLWINCPKCKRPLDIPENRREDVLRFAESLTWLSEKR